MATLRVAHRHRYTAVDRATVRDTRLSFRALGVLVRLLDQPDGAEVDSERLSLARPEGRDAIRTALRELEACGYLVRQKQQGERGRWTTITWVLERPLEPGQTVDQLALPGTGNPASAAPASANQALKKENPTVTDVTVKAQRRDAAKGIVGRVYRARTPRPATPFNTAVGIVERVLAAGHDEAAVERALGTVRSVSLSAVEHELTSAPPRKAAPARPVDQDRDGESGRMAL